MRSKLGTSPKFSKMNLDSGKQTDIIKIGLVLESSQAFINYTGAVSGSKLRSHSAIPTERADIKIDNMPVKENIVKIPVGNSFHNRASASTQSKSQFYIFRSF